jgi:hypothetical protein
MVNEEHGMTDNFPPPENLLVPPEIEAQFEGEWIALDTDSCVVLAHAPDLGDIVADTRELVAKGKLIYFHHILKAETILV